MNLTIDPRSLQLPENRSTNLDAKERDLQALRRSCREFEAIYIQEMYKAMRKSLPDGGLFEKDMSTQLYQEMLDMEMARQTAAGDGMGIGKAMYEQLRDQYIALHPEEEEK